MQQSYRYFQPARGTFFHPALDRIEGDPFVQVYAGEVDVSEGGALRFVRPSA